ncbi:cell wall elongation regulator TseB-like domain-containing protein [Gordoniibacillus kamchatkensis]|uniref:cell wall elongation regulator TseB-like domain-containing protein n=1 Tax=Gordoniibacillus kamchatkensis TaxID=1590651 RepID=UPI000698C463|nr:DUF5590 domain-containing protein [Paenibacillus sp. VKM B-2647]
MGRRIAFFALFAAVTLVILLSRFYYGVQHDHWLELDQAKTAASKEAGLVQIDNVQSFNGDAAYTIVTGTDAQHEKLIVWLGPSGTHIEKASAGISPDEARNMLLKRAPDAEVLRVVPAKLHDDYVWELFYRRPEPSGAKRYYYDYVKFADGAHIDTYRLSLQ